MILQSKELISEVLDLKINLVEYDEYRSKIYYYYNQFGKITGEINIYELAHKCKEWAKKKQYYLFSALQENDSICIVDGIDNDGFYVEQIKYFHEDTEPEAIFKACEYIMEQTKCGS